VTSDGSPYRRFQLALRRGNLRMIELAAKELPRIPLGDALMMVVLMERNEDERFDRAAARWVGRLILEVPSVGIEEARRALDALDRLPDDAAQQALSGVCAEAGLR
jgi:ribosomal 50S subunit-associated protein YjgA (DUF615 family)